MGCCSSLCRVLSTAGWPICSCCKPELAKQDSDLGNLSEREMNTLKEGIMCYDHYKFDEHLLRKVFGELDVNGDGRIYIDSAAQKLVELGVSHANALKFFSSADDANVGTLTYLQVVRARAKFENADWEVEYPLLKDDAHAKTRICVVGAGPAGLTMAKELFRHGFTNVTIIEASDRVGGQSHSENIDGTIVDRGTCYVHQGYKRVKQMCREYGIPIVHHGQAAIVTPEGAPSSKGPSHMPSMLKYVALWTKWTRSSPSSVGDHTTFSDWLNKNGLEDLTEAFIFNVGSVSQGYGPYSSVAAHNMLRWLTLHTLASGLGGGILTGMLSGGWEQLWAKVSHECSCVRLNSPVESVRSVADDKVEVAIRTQGGEVEVETFDQVIVTVPLDAVEHPLSSKFTPSSITHTNFASVCWSAASWPLGPDTNRFYINPYANTGEFGKLLSVRCDNYNSSAKLGKRAVGETVLYLEEHADELEEDRKADIIAQLEAQGLTDIQLSFFEVFRYNVRFSEAGLRDGLVAEVDAAQGVGGVWYHGGLLSHWNVASISDFSALLALRLRKEVGDERDVKIEAGPMYFPVQHHDRHSVSYSRELHGRQRRFSKNWGKRSRKSIPTGVEESSSDVEITIGE